MIHIAHDFRHLATEKVPGGLMVHVTMEFFSVIIFWGDGEEKGKRELSTLGRK